MNINRLIIEINFHLNKKSAKKSLEKNGNFKNRKFANFGRALSPHQEIKQKMKEKISIAEQINNFFIKFLDTKFAMKDAGWRCI